MDQSTLNDFFDKVYCINLDRRNDRWDENCLPQFNRINLKNVERISAVDGKTLDLPHGDVYNGELAGSMSHLMALKKAKEESVSKLLLLEDDVVFKETINNDFFNIIQNLPSDWDIIFFGGNHQGGGMQITNGIIRIFHSYAIHACGINNKCFDNLINYLDISINNVLKNRHIKFTPSVAADFFLAQLHKNLNVYCFYPHLAWQLEGFSDIQQSFTDYHFLKN